MLRIKPLYEHLPPVVLASSSPRRAELLRALGLDFRTHSVSINEGAIASEHGLYDQPIALARSKALSARWDLAEESRSCLIIAADTVVIARGQRLDKPSNRDQALQTLRLLSGETHEVLTGVALVGGGRVLSFSERTQVRFARMGEREIAAYIDACEPYDKAGGYGIQEWIGLARVESIEGSYTNVMGLPTARLHRELLCWGVARG